MKKTRRLPTLLHIILIWCLSVQESVQLGNDNIFEDGISWIDFNVSVSKPIRLQLYSRASMKHLRIMEGRAIDAMGDNGDAYARLIIRTDFHQGQITIQGEETAYYLCINKKGQAVGRKKIKRGSGVSCVFTETISNKYTELKAVQPPRKDNSTVPPTEMHLGFNRNGRAVSAHRTRPGVRAVQFLKRRLVEDSAAEESSTDTDDLYMFYDLIKKLNPREKAARDDTDS